MACSVLSARMLLWQNGVELVFCILLVSFRIRHVRYCLRAYWYRPTRVLCAVRYCAAICLRMCYAVPGTSCAVWCAIGLRACYAMPGTGVAYADTMRGTGHCIASA
eukprot:2676226-Rhodomonas_salina.1